MSDFEQTRTLIRRRLGLEDIHAVLGDENGVVYDDPLNRKGDMRVRYVTASALSLPPVLPQGPNYVGQDTPGTPVICRYDNNNQLVVWGNDIPGQKANGMNPVANNPAATVNQETTSTETFIPFSSSPTSPASAFIVVRSHIWNNAGTRTLFAAGDDDGSGGFKGKKDLTAFFPSAGNHRLIAYFLKTDNTLEIVGSTTQPIPEPLDFTDILELFAAASANALPGQAWHLADGQTTLVQGNYWIDLRDIINGSASGSVNGPGTSTDRAIATWNGTAGNALRDNPNATIDASGNLSAPKLTAFDTDPQAFIDGSSSAAIYLRDRGSGSDLKNFRILNDAGVLSIAQINDAFSSAALFMQFTASSLLTTIVNRLSTQSGENHKVRVVTAAGAVTVTTADFIVVVNKTVGAATTVNLPSSPVAGDVYIIKDGKGDATTNNITLTPAAGNIDGAGTYVISVNYGAVAVVYNGTQWNVQATNADLPGITLQNLVANGGFDFAQRQTPGTLTTIATDKWGPDRWRSSRETASLQYIRNSAIGESGITSRYYGQYKQITASGKFMVYQILEGADSQPLLSKTVTWQIKMKASASKTIRMAFIELQNAGTIDTIPATFVSAYNANSTDPTLGTNLAYVGTPSSKSVTTSWTSFSVTAALPSNSKNIILALWTDSQFAANDTLSLAEAGGFVASVEQSWTPEAIALDLVRCQRYYCKTFSVDSEPKQNAGTLTPGCLTMVASSTLGNGIVRWGYPVAMRAVPTVTTYNPTQSNANWRNTADTGDATATQLGVGDQGASIYFSSASGDTFYQINASAEAEL